MSDIARTPAQLGAVIRRQRKRKGLSQTQLAEKTQLRQASISQLENGELQLKTLMEVLAALNLELVVQERTRASQSIEDLF
ncbi:helix-turn-helix domain-containing protein [Pelagibacterium luteolum]|uniref:HTH-type transcriptional regulator / antitoxin HipB n=1 Tax=Pelagibacterium luteolum TaxID=440168 RepID=A0A1G8AMZ9_9HYPH|nr:helix-turn-helix transcriptional regulator [Pelagibacterium luteolum]SDH22223.1 HTH-type transcriptional regulator / antitoxin HipB [Pelagibacterium luteolum]